MALLTDAIARGTIGARPAAGSPGRVYFSTEPATYRDNGSSWDDVSDASSGGSGSITASGYTQNTARLLGRTTASAGAIEEITVGSGLSLAAGALTASGSGGQSYIYLYVPASDILSETGPWMRVQYTDILGGAATTPFNGLGYQSNGAQNDQISWDFWLEPGTYAVTVTGRKSSNTGIITVNLDAASQGTIDTYAAGPAYLNGTVTGMVVATKASHTIQLIMATKNASSSAYYGELFAMTIRRTA